MNDEKDLNKKIVNIYGMGNRKGITDLIVVFSCIIGFIFISNEHNRWGISFILIAIFASFFRDWTYKILKWAGL